MKRILTYISLFVFGAALFSSCNLNESPKFDDKDAFVAFDKAAVSVKEDGGQIAIPVTLASLKGIATTISYEAVDGTAKQGENYSLVDEAGTLTFSAENRTQYILIDIKDIKGTFTGDLKFSLKFKSTGDVNEGAEKSCTITITDNDHPLIALLGKYSATAISYYNGASSWDLELMKDAEDVNMVWIAGIIPYFANSYPYPSYDTRFYGIVDLEAGTISLPIGQTCGYKYQNTYDVSLVGVDFPNIVKSGNIVLKIDTSNGVVIKGEELGIYITDDTGAWDLILPQEGAPITFTKK